MKINVLQKVMGLDGQEAVEAPTMRDVCVKALVELTRSDQEMSGKEKFEMGMLAQKIYQEDEPDLIVEDVSKLKDRIGKLWGPLVVAWAWNALDGNGQRG